MRGSVSGDGTILRLELSLWVTQTAEALLGKTSY
jgi:hypothetical protein